MKERSRSKYLIQNIIIFALGNVATKIITFLLVPIYTAVLSVYEYGIIDIVMTVITVAVPVVTLNICEAVMRFALDKNAEKEKITQIGTNVYLTSCFLGFFVIPVCNLFENLSQYSILIYLYLITMAGSQLYLCNLRGREMLLQYSIGNIIHTFLVAAFNILFLVYLDMGVRGYLMAYILACTITMIYSLIIGKSYESFKNKKVDKSLFRKMTKYSIVLIPNSFMWWIMNSSDRIMVSAMIGIAANGIYSVSYKLPSIITVATSVFNQAWGYSAIKEEDSKDEVKYNNRVFLYLICISMMTGITLCTFIKPFLKVYVTVEYYEAWKYTPFLITGCVYLTLGTFTATSYSVHKDSFGFLFSGMFGALFNVILNFILIPYIQVYGAAVATCVSYVLVFLFRLIHTRKYLEYDIHNKEFMFGTVALIMSAGSMFIDNGFGQIIQIIIFIAALVFYVYIIKELLGIKMK